MPAFIRAAFAGRTSTYDQQDPTLSLPRQLRASQDALPEDAVIVAHYYDVESGRKNPRIADAGMPTNSSKSRSRETAGSPTCWQKPSGPTAGSTS